ncbi:gamma-glutamyl-gamma-aminobutyrate hydrolase family protein [Helicobacter sp. faydin-H20]|uniref:gamma-glutamyl-CDP-amidate hydrolase n=1 Tax=Helicobacter anatolicus TaxID=2905874 RepID=UPI001E3806E6|nr:gamma-glutamyl-CDP-amidate hydrolase [Helicobacter anatolicus]MCE3037122.1 gamma-glutamyl-gamma-aminobutyrate hydrolase family protein [Helicobacter anatolicus]
MKKLIGITQRLIEHTQYSEIREALALDWGTFFCEKISEDFLPLALSSKIDFKDYIPYLSGVILSGGNDLNSLNPNKLSLFRDTYEKNILKLCLQNHIPVFGVCRGAQMIAEFFCAKITPIMQHTSPHLITFQSQNYKVNSYHNYGISELCEDFEVLGIAINGSIEAFKHKNKPIYGIMWHLEREENLSIPSQKMWKMFIENFKEKKCVF